jgi:hypothetical protein
MIVLLYFFSHFWELRCVALLYVAAIIYFPFVLSLLACGRSGPAKKFLMDTAGFSTAQRVGVFFFIPSVPASAPPPLLLGLLGTRIPKMCVLRFGVAVARSEKE